MARDIYQNTIAQAQADGTLKALANVQVFVYAPGTTNVATIYAARTGATTVANPILTGATGAVEFYADVGEYDVRFLDTIAPARIADRTVQWNALSGANGGIPTAKLTRDGGIDLAALAADVLRQATQIGQVIDWWRPAATVPIPSGFEIADGRTIAAANHDFGTGSSITLPDLRNTFILGADSGKAQGTAAGGTDGVADAPGIGGAGGSQRHTLSVAELAQHAHGADSNQDGHVHGMNGWAGGGGNPAWVPNGGWVYAEGQQAGGANKPIGVTESNDPSISTTIHNTGSSNAHNNIPKYVGLLKLMKVRRS